MRARIPKQKIPGTPRWCGYYRTHTTGRRAGPDGEVYTVVTVSTHTGPFRMWVWRAWWDLLNYLDRWSDPHRLWADPPYDQLNEDDEGGGRDALRLRR